MWLMHTNGFAEFEIPSLVKMMFLRDSGWLDSTCAELGAKSSGFGGEGVCLSSFWSMLMMTSSTSYLAYSHFVYSAKLKLILPAKHPENIIAQVDAGPPSIA